MPMADDGTSGGDDWPEYGQAFAYDLFISYAHGPVGETGRGPLQSWSRQFQQLLKLNLPLLGVDPARIYFDNGTRAEDRVDSLAPLDEQFAAALKKSAMLQVHVSNHYLKSKWCAKELAAWLACQPTKPGSADRRISLIRVGDTGDKPWPDALQPGGTQLPGPFFHDRGTPVPWGLNQDFEQNVPSPAFNTALINEAGAIARRIEELKGELRRRAAEERQVRLMAAGAATGAPPPIYLHGRARERPLWDKVAADLTTVGMEIRPSRPAPDDDEQTPWGNYSKVASGCVAMVLVGNDPSDLDVELDVIGRDRRNYIRSRFGKFLPCAVLDRAGLKTPQAERSARLRDVDWLEAGHDDWPLTFKSWLETTAARVTADKYGVTPEPPEEGPQP